MNMRHTFLIIMGVVDFQKLLFAFSTVIKVQYEH